MAVDTAGWRVYDAKMEVKSDRDTLLRGVAAAICVLEGRRESGRP
jgi:hypothetical protein